MSASLMTLGEGMGPNLEVFEGGLNRREAEVFMGRQTTPTNT